MTLRLRLVLAVSLLLLVTGARAQELHTLTVPASVTTTTYTVSSVYLDVANGRIVVQLVSNQGVTLVKVYDASTAPSGATLLHNLNTANFSTNSLVKAIFNRLAADGVIPAGSVSGTPQ